MNTLRLGFFIFFCVAASIWAVSVLMVQAVRLEHHNLIAGIQSRKAVPDQSALEEAIADYDRVMRIVTCNVSLHKDRTLLLTFSADIAMASPASEDVDGALEKTLQSLASQLSCTPMDGKAWLDYAAVNVYREGFTDRSLAAYKMSERVTPGESWLAEKRLMFAVKFRPLFDTEALTLAQKDLATLERAAAFRMKRVMKAADLKSKEDLYAFFN